MEITIAEAPLILGAVYILYLLLKPLRRRIESWIFRMLDPKGRRIIDVTPRDDKKSPDSKE